jgi:hypothetical protein
MNLKQLSSMINKVNHLGVALQSLSSLDFSPTEMHYTSGDKSTKTSSYSNTKKS